MLQRAVLVTQAQSQCPSAKVVMSGYSQGAQLVHNAAKLLPAATMSALSSVVVFGDPGMSISRPVIHQTFADFHKKIRDMLFKGHPLAKC